MKTDTQTHGGDTRYDLPAPNKAQHSPEYIKCGRCGSNVWATRIDHHLTWCPEKETDYKAHADKLAEALRECRMALTLDYTGSTKRNKALCDVSAAASQAHNKAVLALAAYEESI